MFNKNHSFIFVYTLIIGIFSFSYSFCEVLSVHTLTNNETWTNDSLLENSVIVPNGIVLTINANITLAGNYIHSTGGTINLSSNGSVSLSPNHGGYLLVYPGSVIRGYFPTLYGAINNADVSNTVVYALGSCSFFDNYSNTSMVDVHFNGSLDLNGHWFYMPNGNIYSNQSITGIDAKLYSQDERCIGLFESVGYAMYYANEDYDRIVELMDKTYSINIGINMNTSIRGMGIDNTIINGSITINNSRYSSSTIENLSFSQGINRILNYGGVLYINNIKNDNEYGIIHISNAADFRISNLTSNSESDMDFAINISNTSGGVLENSTITGQLGAARSGASVSFHVDNNYFCGNGYDLYVESGGMAHSCDNTFSRQPSLANYGFVVYGYGCDTSVCNGLYKNTIIPIANTSINSENDLSSDEYYLIDSMYYDLMGKIDYTYRKSKYSYHTVALSYSNQFELIADKLFCILNQYPDTKHFKSIILKLVHCCGLIEKNEKLYGYLKSIIDDNKFSDKKFLIQRYLIDYYKVNRQYENAILIADNIISGVKNDSILICEVLYEKGLIYQYCLNNNENAIDNFLKIINDYPDNEMTLFAKNQLDLLNYKITDKPMKSNDNSTKDGITIDCYPNPFNLTTTFKYSIPTTSHVRIKVFDIMGREVSELINETKSAGEYITQWNGIDDRGENAPSGMYFYSIETEGKRITQKMVLMK